MPDELIIHWFRQDLRLADNPSLTEAAREGQVLPIYILNDDNSGKYKMGAASRWWLHHSLNSLNQSLDGNLAIFKGDAKSIISQLIKNHPVKAVYWNRSYEPQELDLNKQIKQDIEAKGLTSRSFNGCLLWEPWTSLKADGTPYKVFTPFYKNAIAELPAPRIPLPAPSKINFYSKNVSRLTINGLKLSPKHPWSKQLAPHWNIGEDNAQQRLEDFIKEDLNHYKQGRDFPALNNVSRLSPHLHFGEVSPHQVWHAANLVEASKDQEHFLRELGWREFSYHLLYHFPDLPEKNFNNRFDRFPWKDNSEFLKRWQKGQTGYPLVDAGMRELWQTGYMHNRVRMVVGSFLVKNLLLHWHHGEQWFWDTLLDADLANNSASWQWVAGCGADAAPYFRIFNPCTQGEKFDPHGEYTREYVPELANLPDTYLFHPWDAPADVLSQAGITLGKTYPKPIVDLKISRDRALAAYDLVKG